MPLVIGRGYGRDDKIIIQRVIGDAVTVQVRLSDVIQTTVEQEEAPFVQVSDNIVVTATVQLEDSIACVVQLAQPILAVVSPEGECMSTADNSIRMFRGDNRDADITANWPDGTPLDFTGAKVTMTVKERASDDDLAALFQRKNTAAGGSDAEIFMSNPTGGQFTVHIVPDNTSDVNPGVYVYDMQAILASGKVVTLVKDKFILKLDVTHSES